MQHHRIISLYPETAGECPVSRTFRRRRAANFRLLADIVDLTVTAAIGVGVLVCFLVCVTLGNLVF